MLVFVAGTLIILGFLAWGTYRSAQMLRYVPPSLNLLLLPPENVVRLVLIGVCLELGEVSGLPYARLGWKTGDLIADVAIGLLVGMLVAAIVPPLTQVAVRSFGKQVYSPIVVRSILPRTRRQWLLVPLALISAVFLEELLFRSLLLGGFGVFASPLVLAVGWSLIFGAMHLPQGSLGMVVASALGLVLSALFLVTGSLLTPFVAHYVINLVQLIWASLDRTWIDEYSVSPE